MDDNLNVERLQALNDAAIEAAALAFAQAFYGPNFDGHLNPEAFDMAMTATRAALATPAILAMVEEHRVMREALEPFAKLGAVLGSTNPYGDFYVYRPAIGDDYALYGDHLRAAARALGKDQA